MKKIFKGEGEGIMKGHPFFGNLWRGLFLRKVIKGLNEDFEARENWCFFSWYVKEQELSQAGLVLSVSEWLECSLKCRGQSERRAWQFAWPGSSKEIHRHWDGKMPIGDYGHGLGKCLKRKGIRWMVPVELCNSPPVYLVVRNRCMCFDHTQTLMNDESGFLLKREE